MKPFDIAPFGLPKCAANEIRFEQPRDICRVKVCFADFAPAEVGLSYLNKIWPQTRHEYPENLDMTNPVKFGWRHIDDWFNVPWKPASVRIGRPDEHTVEFTFEGLHAEFAEFDGRDDYNVTFRRTLGVRVDVPDTALIRKIEVYTTSTPAKSKLRVELDAGMTTPGGAIVMSGYNIRKIRITPQEGVRAQRKKILLDSSSPRRFMISLEHMRSEQRYSDDDGHVMFSLDHETFTISLTALHAQGAIWFAEQGVFVSLADDPTVFTQYRERLRSAKTICQRVQELPEQSLSGAFQGQPRPHAVACTLGCKHARQRFWLEPNGDVVMIRRGHGMKRTPGADSERFASEGNNRFFFDLGEWIPSARFTDPPPAFAWNLQFNHGSLVREHRYVAVPLDKPIANGELAGDDTVVLMLRIQIRNTGDTPVMARVPLGFSGDSRRSDNRIITRLENNFSVFDDNLSPLSPRERLTATGDGRITSAWQGCAALRCMFESDMTPVELPDGLLFERQLEPGENAHIVMKIPFITLDRDNELQNLRSLQFDVCDRQAREFWSGEAKRGAQIQTPNAKLNALHIMHMTHVQVTDYAMPGDNRLINTSVGSSTYGNFVNESCLIIEELDQRGLHDEARRRIEVWLKYQGTEGLNGQFSDHDGVFFGAGGFESGFNYCQNHGWGLWIIARHYFLTGDAEWIRSVAEQLIKGVDWVFRQRRNTLKALPHSRSWERGFLPAGGLEDVGDYWYWLSTNVLTWRGCDTAAAALEAVGHPQSGRVRAEADAYKQDLLRGFETMRQHAPLVRLRDGRWVPHYPARLYCRNRDTGWIRETLEGSIYLLISGLYAPESPQARWILDDYQDNRYMSPPFGYAVEMPESTWFDRGGFSIQPNLLAGLMPHLERDEIEVYLWMFFNSWNACYREEINGMVEHPYPFLGFSNSAHFKTSDEANAIMWLRYMFVYATDEVLHIGKAIPRGWLLAGRNISADLVVTRFGVVSVTYESAVCHGSIRAEVRLDLRSQPKQTLVRFRNPSHAPLKSVSLNGKQHHVFKADSGDVDVTGMTGDLVIQVEY
jgi:hypothetical protein